jgi:transcription elongation factor Elf1
MNPQAKLDQGTLEALQRDTCPDCGHLGLDGGPRGGSGQNLFCGKCGAGFNVALPRCVIFAERIGRRE